MITVVEWQDEHKSDSYPLSASFEIESLFVDATFQVFDDSVPILSAVEVGDEAVVVKITLDEEEYSSSLAFNSNPTSGVYVLSFTKTLGTGVIRIIGRVVISASGLATLKNSYIGTTMDVTIPFSELTVFSLNSESGLYSINDKEGIVRLKGYVDPVNVDNLSDIGFAFSKSTANNDVIQWSAVFVDPGSPYLKTINGISPTNNNFILSLPYNVQSTEPNASALKIQPNADGLTLSLINGTTLNTAVSSELWSGPLITGTYSEPTASPNSTPVVAPTIVTQPQSVEVYETQSTTLTVVASGTDL